MLWTSSVAQTARRGMKKVCLVKNRFFALPAESLQSLLAKVAPCRRDIYSYICIISFQPE